MKTVTFTKAFSIVEDERTTTTYPEGWVGEVEDDIADAAAEEGCIEVKGKPKVAKTKAAKASGETSEGADTGADEGQSDAETPPA
jgi:hypothetical protein